MPQFVRSLHKLSAKAPKNLASQLQRAELYFHSLEWVSVLLKHREEEEGRLLSLFLGEMV